jgi:predicted transcriptional regulator
MNMAESETDESATIKRETARWTATHISEGLADAVGGRLFAHDQVRAWLKTWGDETEALCPTSEGKKVL